MELRCIYLRQGKKQSVPEGWEIHHSSVVEDRGRKPSFLVLMTKTKSGKKVDKDIGFILGNCKKAGKKVK